MVDPRREAVLIRPVPAAPYEDRTSNVAAYRTNTKFTYVTFERGGKEYRYSSDRVATARSLERIELEPGTRVEVDGALRLGTPDAYRFRAGDEDWWRLIFPKRAGGEWIETHREQDVRILADTARQPRASSILAYWRSIVAHLSDKDDPLRVAYETLDFVHPESALGRYLEAEPVTTSDRDDPLIFPFSCNLSQREAVQKALRHPVSVIDGPPGTGKTQTILNLIANVIDSGSTVGIVSFNNAAVDNVWEKLEREGFGYVVANLGRAAKREQFFAHQAPRNDAVRDLLASPPEPRPSPDTIAELDRILDKWQQTERELARHREELEAYRLERRHFTQYLDRQDLPDLERLPLLRKSPRRILDYLAETDLDRGDRRAVGGLLRRIRRYFRYGPTRELDPDDTSVILRLQRAYYDRRIDELERRIERLETVLEGADLTARADHHRQLSVQALRASLRQRYAARAPVEYASKTYRRSFATFVEDYPVILSTCHSLRRSLADGFLLDYLIIDEASQVNLLAAGLALASARNIVVVGDESQLEHIADEDACEQATAAPARAYDYRQQNILSSLNELYGERVPRTLLQEHYRCDPAIIGFCNKKFYDGQLIPYTSGDPEARPLTVVRTVEGNHMRQHRDRGRTNQREIDVIREEVLPQHCDDVPDEEIGITTPYRRQANKVTDDLIDSIQADTVHKFQGREKQAIVMTTVLDETRQGRIGVKFADDPHLVNVAVSRATKKFVLVTNHDMLPRSRNLRDLIGYIQYRNPDDEVIDGTIVSVFDLLYRDYSARLRPLADKLTGTMKYKSEDIVWTLLHDIFSEPPYNGLHAVGQVLLHSLIPDQSGLTPEQTSYVDHRASVDFVVYNQITNQLVLVIEVDGFAYHENNPAQLQRDEKKNAICETCRIPLLRLPTTGSGEADRIRRALDSQLHQD